MEAPGGERMNYGNLKEYMHKYRMGELSKNEMAAAIHMWQRSAFSECWYNSGLTTLKKVLLVKEDSDE